MILSSINLQSSHSRTLSFILIPSLNLVLDLNGSNMQVAQPKFWNAWISLTLATTPAHHGVFDFPAQQHFTLRKKLPG